MADEQRHHPLGTSDFDKPHYFENVATDNLYAICLQLGSALWVVKERLNTIETLIEQKGVLTKEEVELYRVPTEMEPARIAERNKFIYDLYKSIKENPG